MLGLLHHCVTVSFLLTASCKKSCLSCFKELITEIYPNLFLPTIWFLLYKFASYKNIIKKKNLQTQQKGNRFFFPFQLNSLPFSVVFRPGCLQLDFHFCSLGKHPPGVKYCRRRGSFETVRAAAAASWKQELLPALRQMTGRRYDCDREMQANSPSLRLRSWEIPCCVHQTKNQTEILQATQPPRRLDDFLFSPSQLKEVDV